MVRISEFKIPKPVIVLLVIVCMTGILMWADSKKVYPKAKYYVGEIVYTKIGNYQGQILDVNCYVADKYCTYTVRLVKNNQTMFGLNVENEVFKTEWLQEYEIR